MNNRITLFILTVTVTIVGLTSGRAFGDYVCGDVNADNVANISDAVHSIQYIFAGGSPPDCGPYFGGVCGDNNLDELLTISDVVHLINWTFSGGPEPDCLWGVVTDMDGIPYRTKKIGNQYWMVENLKVTQYRNGVGIPNVDYTHSWSGLTTGAYCNFENNPGYVPDFGRLYNWYAVADPRGLAPAGWHIPSDDEWKALETYLGMSSSNLEVMDWRGAEGGKLKEAGTAHWQSVNFGATNESGFTARGGGERFGNGTFNNYRLQTQFWSTSEYTGSYTGAIFRGLSYSMTQIQRAWTFKASGKYVRCVKD